MTISIPPGTKNINGGAAPVSRSAVACLAGAAVAAAVVSAPILAPAPARAACDNYQFKGGSLQIALDSGASVTIPAAGQTLGPGQAVVQHPGGGAYGNASGGITGSKIDFTVGNWNKGVWAGKQTWFTGSIRDDGSASGFYMVNTDGPAGWHTNGNLSCVAAPAPAVPAPAPMPKLPPPSPSAPKVLEGPAVSWDQVLGGLIARVTDRSGVASDRCIYRADSYTSPVFSLGPNETHDVVIVPAVPKFGTWAVTVTCSNGTKTQTSTFY